MRMKNLSIHLKNFKSKLQKHEHTHFDTFILVVICFSAVLIGLETDHDLMSRWAWLFHTLDAAILWIFVSEVFVKVWAQGTQPWRYFRDPWNLFDFVIVVIGFAPMVIGFLHAESVTDLHAVAAFRIIRLARAVRVLRVFRLVTHLRELQILVETLVGSFRKLLYVGLLLVCLFYVYAVIGVFLFRDNDPEHFGNLMDAHMTLFQCITGDGWSALMNAEIHPENSNVSAATESYPFLAPLYFASFIILGSYVLLNLVVGIIISAMEQANEEQDRERDMEIIASEQMQWQMLKDISLRLVAIEEALKIPPPDKS